MKQQNRKKKTGKKEGEMIVVYIEKEKLEKNPLLAQILIQSGLL